MLHAAGLGDLVEIPAQGLDVVGGAHGLQRRVETAGQPGVLGGHAGGAGVGVAFLRLDAADGQHRLPSDVHHVAAEREGHDRVVRQAEFSSPMKPSMVTRRPLRAGHSAAAAGHLIWTAPWLALCILLLLRQDDAAPIPGSSTPTSGRTSAPPYEGYPHAGRQKGWLQAGRFAMTAWALHPSRCRRHNRLC